MSRRFYNPNAAPVIDPTCVDCGDPVPSARFLRCIRCEVMKPASSRAAVSVATDPLGGTVARPPRDLKTIECSLCGEPVTEPFDECDRCDSARASVRQELYAILEAAGF